MRPLRAFHAKVAGVTFPNDDGSSRQKILARCKVGESLRLILRPMEGHPNAVAVTRANGEQVGWLSESVAREIAEDLRRGRRVDVEISDLTGGGMLFKRTRGCNVKITRYSLR